MKPARIGIIGSANLDLVVRADHMPAPGENVLGDDLRMIPGGKGANQAVAVARLGGRARFIGRVGRDSFGEMLLASLRADGVDTDDLAAVADAPTGAALIVIDRNGQNSIVVAPGANRRLMPADIQALRPALETLDAILMQLEIPIETVVHTIRLAREINVPVILDAGPARQEEPPDEIFRVAVLSPNEAEAGALLGRAIRNLKEAEAAAREMLRRGAGAVVLKLGSNGALLVTGDECLHVPAHRVKVVDTTAAGDAFTAALALYRAEGLALPEAVRMANKAGALATTKLGAQPSMPSRAEVEAMRNFGNGVLPNF
jgi:ribokinase